MIDLVGHDHAREHADHVFGAQYDDVRERYASEIGRCTHNPKTLRVYWRVPRSRIWRTTRNIVKRYMITHNNAGFDSAEEYETYSTHLLETAEREHSTMGSYAENEQDAREYAEWQRQFAEEKLEEQRERAKKSLWLQWTKS